MKISVCITQVRDQEMIDLLRPVHEQWADEIIIVDGVPGEGVAPYKNAAMSQATGDWILILDADEFLTLREAAIMRIILEHTKADLLRFSLITPPYNSDYKGDDERVPELKRVISEILASGALPGCAIDPLHRRLIRNTGKITHRGYIAEELFRGEVNCMEESIESGLFIWHMTHYRSWAHRHWKSCEQSHRILSALEHPEIQAWTNRFWYDDYAVKNESEIRRLAKEFRENTYPAF